jgi:hypothetical protein
VLAHAMAQDGVWNAWPGEVLAAAQEVASI